MGWAKYYEDNVSIYIGRRVMKESVPVKQTIHDARLIKKAPEIKESKSFSVIISRPEAQKGRRGLELFFQCGVDDNQIRKLQMNGWWWSKVNACWCNLDTKGNRKYAESLLRKGAVVSVVA